MKLIILCIVLLFSPLSYGDETVKTEKETTNKQIISLERELNIIKRNNNIHLELQYLKNEIKLLKEEISLLKSKEKKESMILNNGINMIRTGMNSLQSYVSLIITSLGIIIGLIGYLGYKNFREFIEEKQKAFKEEMENKISKSIEERIKEAIQSDKTYDFIKTTTRNLTYEILSNKKIKLGVIESIYRELFRNLGKNSGNIGISNEVWENIEKVFIKFKILELLTSLNDTEVKRGLQYLRLPTSFLSKEDKYIFKEILKNLIERYEKENKHDLAEEIKEILNDIKIL